MGLFGSTPAVVVVTETALNATARVVASDVALHAYALMGTQQKPFLTVAQAVLTTLLVVCVGTVARFMSVAVCKMITTTVATYCCCCRGTRGGGGARRSRPSYYPNASGNGNSDGARSSPSTPRSRSGSAATTAATTALVNANPNHTNDKLD